MDCSPAVGSVAAFFRPEYFSPFLCLVYVAIALCYGRGLIRLKQRPQGGAVLSFILGLLGLYLFTQTGLDTLGRRLFAVHRAQHLVLHHLAPFLIALAAPAPVLAAGLPRAGAARLAGLTKRSGLRRIYIGLQQPVIGGLLFVGLIGLWLTPAVHHRAMASSAGYALMNGSMALEGLAFWWFMLDRRAPGASPATHGIATRMLVLWAVMPPQIAIGAYITFASPPLYPSYGVAERCYSLSAAVDQQIGGLLTWIPPAMMSLVASLVILRFGFAHRRTIHGRSRSAARRVDPGPGGNPTSAR